MPHLTEPSTQAELSYLNEPDETARKAALDHLERAEALLAPELCAAQGSGSGRDIESTVVLGAGTMGTGIALCLSAAGFPVILVEREAKALEIGLGKIAAGLDRRVQRGRLSHAEAEAQKSRVSGSLDLSKSAATADLVIEAVFEDMAVKKSVFASLASTAKSGAILATNTSYLDVNAIAQSAERRAADVIGLHFFSPANVMRLLEIIPSDHTAPDVLLTAKTLGQRLGKIAVQAGNCDGFIGNRLYSAYNREAEFLLQEGARVEQVDHALTKGFGMAMGSFAVRDLAGLDISWARRKAAEPTRDKRLRYSRIGDILCERGHFGRKSGRGFYLYEAGAPKGVSPPPNPEVAEIAKETAEELGIKPAEISTDEIVLRCMLATVVEGARILEEGIALRARDIDLVHVNGYGSPAWRGGPMFWADQVGLSTVLSHVERFNMRHDYWNVPGILRDLVSKKQSFQFYDEQKDALR